MDLLCQIVQIHILNFTGNMAAFDMDDPKAVVSPGGVGFDINCGVKKKSFTIKYKLFSGSNFRINSG